MDFNGNKLCCRNTPPAMVKFWTWNCTNSKTPPCNHECAKNTKKNKLPKVFGLWQSYALGFRFLFFRHYLPQSNACQLQLKFMVDYITKTDLPMRLDMLFGTI